MSRSRLIDKRRLTTGMAKHLINPVVRRALERGVAPPMLAILETTGRRTGQQRRTPVGNGLEGERFWIVAEHGRGAAYVRNIEASPRVRVKAGGRWRSGTAHLMPDDDPRARQRRIGRSLGRRINAAAVRTMGTDLLTVRIDLDPADHEVSATRPARFGPLERRREDLRDAVVAGGVAALVSGAPSTLHALLARTDPLEATLAAGTLVTLSETRAHRLILAAAPVHLGLSLGWATALSLVLPRRSTAVAGAFGGLVIAALDLGAVGRRFPRVRALPWFPQIADHLAFGATVGAVLARRRARRRARRATAVAPGAVA